MATKLSVVCGCVTFVGNPVTLIHENTIQYNRIQCCRLYRPNQRLGASAIQTYRIVWNLGAYTII